MGKLTVNKVKSIVNNKEVGRHSDGGGLYLMVPRSGNAYWMLRYTIFGKRKEMTIAKAQVMSLADARLSTLELKKRLNNEEDPLLERKQSQMVEIKLVDQLFNDWFSDLEARLKHPKTPKRIYNNEIQPFIGSKKLGTVKPLDIRHIIKAVADSNRPTVANDTLQYCKQLFNHGMKLGLIDSNPASAFSTNDAGGIEKSRSRALSADEIDKIFDVFNQNIISFGRDNYLACALLLSLGVRKSELTEARWEEFDLESAKWRLPSARSKTGDGIVIPLSPQVLSWLEELKVRSCGSEYVFPSRRQSKNPHMGKDTLNRAISKMFGIDPGKKTDNLVNLMGSIEHFTVHDLRRSFRSLLSKCNVPPHIAERCLNHKIGKLIDIYDKHDYFEERKAALESISNLLEGKII